MAFEKCGAMWLKDGKNGKFMSGIIEIDGVKHNITMFKNNYKKEDRHPDYIINMRADDDNDSQTAKNESPTEDNDAPF